MDIAGSFIIDASRDRVWSLIKDPKVIARCVPGCSEIDVLNPNSYRATVKIGLGPLKITFQVIVDVIEELAPVSIVSRTHGDEGGRASFVSSTNRLELQILADNKTKVSYASTVSITGRLGRFGLGMMRKKADNVAADFGEALNEIALATLVAS